MVRPKQWLADNGHIAPEKVNARGRLSKAHVDLIMDAVKNGANIDGYSVAPSRTAPARTPDAAPEAPRVERAPAANVKEVVDPGPPVRDESYWQAHVMVDGKRKSWGMREVCQCGNSLTYCRCRVSVVNVGQGHGMVVFSPKS